MTLLVNMGSIFLDPLGKVFPDLVDVMGNIEFLVPKLHLQAHKDDCQYQYSLNYAPNVGRTHAKGIESGWASHNEEDGSTKEMNHGHRHNTLDVTSEDWNWKKVQGMRKFLYIGDIVFSLDD